MLPPDAVSLLSGWLQQLAQRPRSSFGTGLVLSLLLSLWTARYATGAIMTALNVAYDEPESRSLLMFNAVAFALTAVLILFGIAVVALVAVLPAVVGLLPLPAGWLSAVSLLRWPMLAALTVVALAALYRYAPNRADPSWEWASAGAIAATALWLIGSYGFSIYLSRFAGYDQTYGSVGAIVVLLIWFWLGAYAALLGATQLRDRTAAAPEQHRCGGMSWRWAGRRCAAAAHGEQGLSFNLRQRKGRFERDSVPTVQFQWSNALSVGRAIKTC